MEGRKRRWNRYRTLRFLGAITKTIEPGTGTPSPRQRHLGLCKRYPSLTLFLLHLVDPFLQTATITLVNEGMPIGLLNLVTTLERSGLSRLCL